MQKGIRLRARIGFYEAKLTVYSVSGLLSAFELALLMYPESSVSIRRELEA